MWVRGGGGSTQCEKNHWIDPQKMADADDENTISLKLSKDDFLSVCHAFQENRPPKRQKRMKLLKLLVAATRGKLTMDDVAPVTKKDSTKESSAPDEGNISVEKQPCEVGSTCSTPIALNCPWVDLPLFESATSAIVIVGCGEISYLYVIFFPFRNWLNDFALNHAFSIFAGT